MITVGLSAPCAFASEAAQAQPAAVPTPSGLISLDFKEADIHTVLRAISIKSGVNIVAGKEVTGTVTVTLKEVPWEKALEVILKTYGLVYEREANIIRVTTVEKLAQEPLTSEVYRLDYAKAKEVGEAVQKVVSERGSLQSDDRTNVLVVTDIPTNLYKISQVIKRLDKQTPQVLVEARVVETILGDTEKLGIDWTVKVAAAGAARPTTFPFSKIGTQPLGKSSQNFFPSGDPASTSPAFPPQPSGSPTGAIGVPAFPLAPSTLSATALRNTFTFGILDFSQFQAVLEMLESRSKTKTLSNPRITTLNNEEANILVGEEFNVPQFQVNSTTGRLEVTGYKPRQLGVRLLVTPHVNEADEIVVDLHPEVSSFLGTQLLTSGDPSTPQIFAPRFSTREADTQILVRDGQTIVIGGLVKEELTDTTRKVPFLGDVPGMGLAFQKREKTLTRTDLLIFVTIRLIEGREAVGAPFGPLQTSGPDSASQAPSAVQVPAVVPQKK